MTTDHSQIDFSSYSFKSLHPSCAQIRVAKQGELRRFYVAVSRSVFLLVCLAWIWSRSRAIFFRSSSSVGRHEISALRNIMMCSSLCGHLPRSPAARCAGQVLASPVTVGIVEYHPHIERRCHERGVNLPDAQFVPRKGIIYDEPEFKYFLSAVALQGRRNAPRW